MERVPRQKPAYMHDTSSYFGDTHPCLQAIGTGTQGIGAQGRAQGSVSQKSCLIQII